jgi:general secretion pathway protein C
MIEKTKFALRYLGWIIPILIGLAGAYALSGVVAHKPAPEAEVRPRPAEQKTKVASAIRRDAVLEENILGLARSKPNRDAAETTEPAEEPTGPKNWVLIGVLVGEVKSSAIVIIDGEAVILNVDDMVRFWRLAEIHPDKIVWKKDGKTVVTQLTTDQEEVERAGNKKRQQDKKRPVVRKASSFSDKATVDKDYAQSLLNDPGKLLEQALYKPYSKDGEIVGFSIRNIQEDSVLEKIGIKENDVLVRLNGEEIKNPTSLLQAYAGLEGSNTISVDVLREGEVKSLLLELE